MVETEMPISREKIYESIIDDFGEGVYCVDTNRKIFFWSRSAERITGYARDEMIGVSCFNSHLDHIDMDKRPLCNLICPLVGTIFDGQQRVEQVFARHKDGHRIPVIVKTFPIIKDGVIVGATEIFHEYLKTECNDARLDEVLGMEMHDPLTGLPNRENLTLMLSYHLDSWKRGGRPFSIAFADLDHFARLNEEYGYETGNRMLQAVAKSLSADVRGDDIVGRWDKESFFAIFAGAPDRELRHVSEKLMHWIHDASIEVNGQTLTVDACVSAVSARPGDTIAGIIERCQKLLFRAKKDGAGQIVITEKF